MTKRPLVDSTHEAFEIITQDEGISTILMIDGQVQMPLRCGDWVAQGC
jgi:hypothetical protein